MGSKRYAKLLPCLWIVGVYRRSGWTSGPGPWVGGFPYVPDSRWKPFGLQWDTLGLCCSLGKKKKKNLRKGQASRHRDLPAPFVKEFRAVFKKGTRCKWHRKVLFSFLPLRSLGFRTVLFLALKLTQEPTCCLSLCLERLYPSPRQGAYAWPSLGCWAQQTPSPCPGRAEAGTPSPKRPKTPGGGHPCLFQGTWDGIDPAGDSTAQTRCKIFGAGTETYSQQSDLTS